MIVRTTLILLGLFFLLPNASARQLHQPSCVETGTLMRPSCNGNNFLAGIRSIKVSMHRIHQAGAVVAHPAGCPARSFCGCGAVERLKTAWGVVFKQSRNLWLAANWPRTFPPAMPAPGMVAARRHHVMVLEKHLSGDIWIVYDANSGKHLTRIHPRSIAGYAIVNPHGAG